MITQTTTESQVWNLPPNTVGVPISNATAAAQRLNPAVDVYTYGGNAAADQGKLNILIVVVLVIGAIWFVRSGNYR